MHSSGEWMATAAEIPEWAGNRGVNALQSFGGALTYMRRYMLTSMLGINAEEDTDGNGDNGNGNGQKPRQAPKRQQPQQEHWIKDENGRKRFWAWTHERGLSRDEVHQALDVEHVEEFSGSKGDAMTKINDYIDARMQAEQAAQEAG